MPICDNCLNSIPSRDHAILDWHHPHLLFCSAHCRSAYKSPRIYDGFCDGVDNDDHSLDKYFYGDGDE